MKKDNIKLILCCVLLIVGLCVHGINNAIEEEKKNKNSRFRLIETQGIDKDGSHWLRTYIIQDTLSEKCYFFIHGAGGGTEIPCQ